MNSFIKSIPQELQNDISDTELLKICSEELSIEHAPFNLTSLITKIKARNYKALPHFAFVKKHLTKIAYSKTYRGTDKARQKLLVKIVTQLELADYLLSQGATMDEIRSQTGLTNDLLALIIKKHYSKIPKEILMFRLINYRILKLAKLQEVFFKEMVLPLLRSSDKMTAYGLLQSFEDLVQSSWKERLALENKLNEK